MIEIRDVRSPLIDSIKRKVGFTPMKSGRIAIRLMEAGADVDYGDYYGDTPLHHAIVTNPQVDIVKLLLEYGADANTKEKRLRIGVTPLYIAAICHHAGLEAPSS